MTDANFRDLVEEVKIRTDIVQVISSRIQLNKSNKALCPFHEETIPSFSVNPRGQYFYCFGCGKGGDVFRFLELYYNKPFMEVLTELTDQAGMSLTKLSIEEKNQIKEIRGIEDILTETAKFYHNSLTTKVKEYLTKERNFNEETISRFRIGYANGGLRKYLTEKCSFSIDLCLKAGVLKKMGESKNQTIYDYFINRVVFPNLKNGRAVYLTGRSLNDQQPKYLHLPSEIKYLYKEDDLHNNEVIITEGIPDCLSATQAGYNAVAVFSALNFKKEFIPKFSRCEKIYICLDSDETGKEGALKIAGHFGEKAKIVELPKESDVNDYLKSHTKEEFASLLQKAKHFIKYHLYKIPTDIDRTELPKLLTPVLKTLATMNKATAEAYLNHEIKPRFKLKNVEIDGYRDLIKEYRNESNNTTSNKQVSKSDAQPNPTACFDGLIDLVEHNGNPVFLVKDGEELKIITQYEKDGRLYVPPPVESLPWLLPRGNEVIKVYGIEKSLPLDVAGNALYDDLILHHKESSELPAEEYYDLLVAWDLHTYLFESFQYSPIICLFAVPERGKSRTGKGMINIAYRGIHVESLRDPYIVRVASNLNASMFFDVKDIWRKAERNQSEDVLLHRFEKGAQVPRVLYPERGAHKDIVYYTIFGPTIIATNESIHNILETRAIQINMPDTRKIFNNDITQEYALPLKERLVAFRARYMGKSLPEITNPVPGRLGNIVKPLMQMILLVRPERKKAFIKLIKRIESDRLSEKSETFEAQIISTVALLENQVSGNILPIKSITDEYNTDKLEKFKISYHKVGRKLKSMGFSKTKTGNGASAIIWDSEKIMRLQESYGLKITSETSEIPETPVNEQDISDVTDVSDVFRNTSEELFGYGK